MRSESIWNVKPSGALNSAYESGAPVRAGARGSLRTEGFVGAGLVLDGDFSGGEIAVEIELVLV